LSPSSGATTKTGRRASAEADDMLAASRDHGAATSLDPATRALAEGVRARDVRAIAKAITLIESSRRDHHVRAEALLEELLPQTGGSFRIGVSGAPGAGKSTFIEALGLHLTTAGHRVAVLAVDPTSAISGGSILGDKTRMERLAREPSAFIRPSPSGGTLGGVAHKTREALAMCEAGGYDVVIVETVGVGQSETAVAGMTDFFALIALPNAGDDLQAIKRGIIELVDLVLVNKADVDPAAAELARSQMTNAFTMLRPRDAWWVPPVIKASAATGTGIDAFWAAAERYRASASANGTLAARRKAQALAWMDALVEHELHARFYSQAPVRQELAALRQAVTDGTMTPARAAARLLTLAK
jgi:LAO/AO transport system kinase